MVSVDVFKYIYFADEIKALNKDIVIQSTYEHFHAINSLDVQ